MKLFVALVLAATFYGTFLAYSLLRETVQKYEKMSMECQQP